MVRKKKSSQWVNVNFQAQSGNRDAKHFSYNFITKSTGIGLNFTLKLIDDENKTIKFEDTEKKISSHKIFACISSMSKSFKKKQKTEEQHIKHVLVKLEKDF